VPPARTELKGATPSTSDARRYVPSRYRSWAVKVSASNLSRAKLASCRRVSALSFARVLPRELGDELRHLFGVTKPGAMSRIEDL
jgi:hypothetical protein